MNELKPEDVMKALEHCANYKREEVSCIECPIRGRCFDEENLLEKAVLALLREKDAEIERLKEHQDTVTIVCERAKEHYHNLYENAKELFKATARSEAITEFFERVCKEVEQTPNANEFFINAWKAKFTEIAKELKGDKE